MSQILLRRGVATNLPTLAVGEPAFTTDSHQLFIGSSGGNINITGGGGGFVDPMSTIGDMIFRNGSNVTTRLPAGTANQAMTIVGGVPTWGTIADANISPTAAISVSKLALGATNQVLMYVGAANVWGTLTDAFLPSGITASKISGALSNATIAAGAITGTFVASQIASVNPSSLTGTGTVPLAALSGITASQISATAGITVSQLSSGTATNGQVPTANGLGGIAWQNPTGSFVDPETTVGDMIFRNGSNVTARLPIGTVGQVLAVSGGIPTWTTVSYGYTSGNLNVTGDFTVTPTSLTVVPILLSAPTGITANLVDLQVNTVSKFTISAAGAITNGTITSGQITGLIAATQVSSGVSAINTVLTSNGTGGVGWTNVVNSLSLSGSILTGALNLIAGTNVTITTSGQNVTINASGSGGAVGMTDPMTTIGDIIIRNASNTTARLGIGATNQVLAVIGGVPSWVNPVSGFADPMTTIGDMIFRNNSNTTTRLPAGTNGNYLQVVGGVPIWAAGPAGATGASVNKVQLEYTQATDLNGIIAVTNTWTDVIGNQTFQVDNGQSLVEVQTVGAALFSMGTGSTGYVNLRYVIDSGSGSPITRNISGVWQDQSRASNLNPFTGCGAIRVLGLTPGAHTIKLQMYSNVPTNSGLFYCRAATNVSEFIYFGVVEREIVPTGPSGTLDQVRAYQNATQSLSSATLTALTFGAEDYNTNNLHSTSINPTRLISQVTGKYRVGGSVHLIATGTTGELLIQVRKNGLAPSLAYSSAVAPGNGNDWSVNVATEIFLNAGDYVEVYVLQSSGGSISTVGDESCNGFMSRIDGYTINPMTASGDLSIGGQSGVPTRLGAGANGQVLTLVNGLPAWVSPSGGAGTNTTLAVSGQTALSGSITLFQSGPITLSQVGQNITISSSAMSDPMTTVGDLIFRNGIDTTTRLPVGTNNQVLTVIGGVPNWANPTTGFADPETTAGDMIFRNSSNITTRLPVGTAGQVLGVSSGLPAWIASPASTTIAASGQVALSGNVVLAGSGSVSLSQSGQTITISTSALIDPMTTTGDLIFRSGTGTTRLGIGSTNQILAVVGGVPTWTTPNPGFADPETTIGDMIFRNGSNITSRLPVGTTGQYLGVSGGLPAWTTPTPVYTTDFIRTHNSTGQTLTTATWTSITFDTNEIGSAMHSTATNTSRITFVNGGTYVISGIIAYDVANAQGSRQARIYKNGTTQLDSSTISTVGSADQVNVQISAQIFTFAANDYIELQGYQDSGNSVSTVASGSIFMAWRVG